MSRAGRRHTSARDIILRAAMALVVAALAIVIVRHGLGTTMRRASPEAALRAAPWDARARAAVAEQAFGTGSDRRARARAVAEAKQALLRDPTAVAAVSTLGFDAAVGGDREKAARLFAYADQLSRRDLRTRLWLIEDSVARGDVDAALRHYDIALRTSSAAPGILFPVLSSAIADAGIRGATARILRTRPVWADMFLSRLATVGPDYRAAADLYDVLRQSEYRFPAGAQSTLIGSLAGSRAYDRAWSLYASLRPGVERTRSRAPDFAQGAGPAAPFDWLVQNDAGIYSVLPTDAGAGLEIEAPPGAGGPAVRQLQVLPPGRYLLTGTVRELTAPRDQSPFWNVTCVDGGEIGRVPLAPPSGAPVRFSGRFTVSGNCPAQWLTLTIPQVDAIEGVSGRIDSALLSRAR